MENLLTKDLFNNEISYKNIMLKYVNGNSMKINSNNILDQYFTKESVAIELYSKTRERISNYEKNIDDFYWIEPSAGNGVFYDLLPIDKRIGIDINPRRSDFIHSDYLNYTLPKNKKIIVIGNPPFGHRGVTALKFINHSSSADYVCFILPMFFESKGKGSVKYRVKNLNLIHSEILPKDSFYTPKDGKIIDVKCVFQIWSKNHKAENEEFNWYRNRYKEPFLDLLKVHTVSLAKNRECGKRWIFNEKADFYISSTFHGNITVVDKFEEVKYKSGIAIILTTKDSEMKNRLIDLLKNADWKKYASLATNSCYHLGKSNVYQLIQDNINQIRTTEV